MSECSLATYSRAPTRGALDKAHTPTGPRTCSARVVTVPCRAVPETQELGPAEYYSACAQVYCPITNRKFLHASRMYACRASCKLHASRTFCTHAARAASPLPEVPLSCTGARVLARVSLRVIARNNRTATCAQCVDGAECRIVVTRIRDFSSSLAPAYTDDRYASRCVARLVCAVADQRRCRRT